MIKILWTIFVVLALILLIMAVLVAMVELIALERRLRTKREINSWMYRR